MVLGAFPLALASGAGSESRRQIGWVIVGGMYRNPLYLVCLACILLLFGAAQTGNDP